MYTFACCDKNLCGFIINVSLNYLRTFRQAFDSEQEVQAVIVGFPILFWSCAEIIAYEEGNLNLFCQAAVLS